ncbi:hypothetical protein D3C87_1407080 [compost metagenome]
MRVQAPNIEDFLAWAIHYLRINLLELSAGHQFHQFVMLYAARYRAHQSAIAQYGDSVADLSQFVHAVTYVDDADAVGLRFAD